ncbi:MAG: hypothetical protein E6312_05920 [Peptoniphilus grossensis]|uniref:YfcC family protein n=1 Tax=Peptoniphilus grossensis TaxID=1465756 RepID=UPI0023F56B3D|nr:MULTISPECIES: YfcC family protein [Peptoniphilaceae]MDU7151592.1 hypothetical protein [Peptoniphilus grossensis]
MNDKKKLKKNKSINSFVLMFFIIVFVAVLTWIIPGGQYELDEAGNAIAGTYKIAEANPQGIWNIIVAPIVGMIGNENTSGAIPISLYVLLFGSFLNMMDKTGVIGVSLNAVSKKFKKNPYLLIVILMFILSFLGTTQGAYEEGYVYVSLFLPIFLALGMDTITVLMIVIFGTMSGNAAGVVNPFATGIASDIAGIPFGTGIIARLVIFFVITSFSCAIVCMYARYIKMNPEKSVQFFRKDEDLKEFGVQLSSENEDTKSEIKGKNKSLLIVFILTFLIMVMALFPWTSINENFTIFEDIANWINTTPIVSTVIGNNVVPLGEWYFIELSALMLVSSIVSGLIGGFSIDETIKIIMDGASMLLSTALMVPMARGIQVIMTDGNITSTILHFTENTLGALPTIVFVFVAFVIYTVFASFMPSSTGLAGATISIMVPLGVFAGVPGYVMIMIYNFALGIAKIYSPTSIIVMTCTQYAKIDYGNWFKAVIKPLILFSLMCLIIIYALVFIS